MVFQFLAIRKFEEHRSAFGDSDLCYLSAKNILIKFCEPQHFSAFLFEYILADDAASAGRAVSLLPGSAYPKGVVLAKLAHLCPVLPRGADKAPAAEAALDPAGEAI